LKTWERIDTVIKPLQFLTPKGFPADERETVNDEYPGGNGDGKDDPKEFLFTSLQLRVGAFARPQEEQFPDAGHGEDGHKEYRAPESH
jgi:hypothetical protein